MVNSQLASVPSAKIRGGSSSCDLRITVGSTDDSGWHRDTVPRLKVQKNLGSTPSVRHTRLSSHTLGKEHRTRPGCAGDGQGHGLSNETTGRGRI